MDPILYQRGAIIVLLTGMFLVVAGRLIGSKYSAPLIFAGLGLIVLTLAFFVSMMFYTLL
ncbi:hypothetical protein QW131_17960 [Roseibium salinum]|nr:hypothetical protein [Roseibium salinum]